MKPACNPIVQYGRDSSLGTKCVRERRPTGRIVRSLVSLPRRGGGKIREPGCNAGQSELFNRAGGYVSRRTARDTPHGIA